MVPLTSRVKSETSDTSKSYRKSLSLIRKSFKNWDEGLFFVFHENVVYKYKQDGRLPPIFKKKAFKKMKTFFFEKHSFFIIFSNFPNVENILVFAKKNP